MTELTEEVCKHFYAPALITQFFDERCVTAITVKVMVTCTVKDWLVRLCRLA